MRPMKVVLEKNSLRAQVEIHNLKSRWVMNKIFITDREAFDFARDIRRVLDGTPGFRVRSVALNFRVLEDYTTDEKGEWVAITTMRERLASGGELET